MIDVLTLNYNDALTTISFVKSIENFSCVKNILIVDNHSSDDSLERLLEIESEKIHVVQTEKNG